MKSLEEIRIIDRREAKILYEALHPYYMNKMQATGSKEGEKFIELKEIQQIYEDLRYFVNNDED